MELADLTNLIMSRRSVRKWEDKEVPVNLLTQAVELATWAPNGGNRQNWHFTIVVNRQIIGAIADAVQNSADLIASWAKGNMLESAFEWQKKASFFRIAPAFIVVSASQYQSLADQILTTAEEFDPRAK